MKPGRLTFLYRATLFVSTRSRANWGINCIITAFGGRNNRELLLHLDRTFAIVTTYTTVWLPVQFAAFFMVFKALIITSVKKVEPERATLNVRMSDVSLLISDGLS